MYNKNITRVGTWLPIPLSFPPLLALFRPSYQYQSAVCYYKRQSQLPCFEFVDIVLIFAIIKRWLLQLQN